MKIDVCIDPSEAAKEFAVVTLRCADHDVECVLDLDFSVLHDRCNIPDPIILDFLFFASVVYGIDKLISRGRTDDRWTRAMEFCLQVSNPERWSTVTEDLEACLSFLTGDTWKIQFTELQHELYRPRSRRKFQPPAKGNTVSLFSGGLDSLIGAIDYLESNPTNSLFLVGHYDRYSKAASDQERVYGDLKNHYQSRLDLLQVKVGPKPSGQEKTYRSRSLLFIAIGMYAARGIGNHTPLLIPENGAIALNVPLTPSRRGSCSTRTAHPFFLNKLREIFEKLGIKNKLCNPLELKTKGECMEECLNRDVLHIAAPKSVSCAKGGHKSWWPNTSAKGCGVCVPCIYRRASLHKINRDEEPYGRKICRIDLDSKKAYPNDFRALVSFLRRNLSRQAIAYLLHANGNIEITCLQEYADIVARSMDEVRVLLQVKGTDEIKRRAGLIS